MSKLTFVCSDHIQNAFTDVGASIDKLVVEQITAITGKDLKVQVNTVTLLDFHSLITSRASFSSVGWVRAPTCTIIYTRGTRMRVSQFYKLGV